MNIFPQQNHNLKKNSSVLITVPLQILFFFSLWICKERLKLFSLKNKGRRGILSKCINTYWSKWRWASQALFRSAQCQDKGNGHKSNPMKSSTSTRREPFVVGVVKHKNRLPRKAVEPPYVEIFQTWLDTTGNWPYLMLLGRWGWTKSPGQVPS